MSVNQEDRIGAIIAAFDTQGWHRTGTPADAACAAWLSEKVRDLGPAPETDAYEISRLNPEQAYVEVAGRRVDGLPLFDCGLTESAGVSGRLGASGSEADIGVVVISAGPAMHQLEELRRKGKHSAIVCVTEGREPGLVASNASSFYEPFGPPVVQVSGEVKDWLVEQTALGSKAQVVATATRTKASSSNIFARLAGRDASLAPVVVTTPRSGWWQCASERGGGIAAWLEVMREVAATEHDRPVWFIAFSGHELGHLGCDAFLERHGDLVRGARAWVHFGANVGGATQQAVRISATDADLLAAARAGLEAAGVEGVTAAPVGQVLGQESGVVASRGANCVSLLGGNAHFHMQSDRWPHAVDVASVARQARGFSALVKQLAHQA